MRCVRMTSTRYGRTRSRPTLIRTKGNVVGFNLVPRTPFGTAVRSRRRRTGGQLHTKQLLHDTLRVAASSQSGVPTKGRATGPIARPCNARQSLFPSRQTSQHAHIFVCRWYFRCYRSRPGPKNQRQTSFPREQETQREFLFK